MSDLHKRGIHNTAFLSELKSGSLKPLVDLIKSNDDLVLQIRDNYFNVYYKGGNVAKVTSPKSVEFDENYFRAHSEKSDEDWDDIKNKRQDAIDLFKKGLFGKYIDTVKSAMETYWHDILKDKGVAEKMVQHQICILNNFQTDYTVIDLEYQVSTESECKYRGNRRTKKGNLPSPRFDIVAIRNSDHRLCIIELKKGTKALKDPSGVQEHAESFANTIGYNKKTKLAFVDEMNNVLLQKRDYLDLLDKGITIDMSLEPEFMFAYQFDSTDKSHPTLDSQKKVFKYYQNKNYVDGVNYAYDKSVLWLNEGDYTLKEKGEK
jgi:hypothetical protein